jgi:hypothetical protein
MRVLHASLCFAAQTERDSPMSIAMAISTPATPILKIFARTSLPNYGWIVRGAFLNPITGLLLKFMLLSRERRIQEV